ncbi:putative cytochrome c1 heme lyase like protein [Verticillium longisporum]|nr:putative cytochrome c1 heme lyase like protein [Verticillium longisporum]
MPDQPNPADACPVDHKSREAWLQQARAAGADATPPHPHASLPPNHPVPPSQPAAPSASWASTLRSYISFSGSGSSPSSSAAQSQTPQSPAPSTTALTTDRVVSTIPRTANPGHSACPAPADQQQQRPANNEADTGADSRTGNWVYPSEKMFFDAMKRKGHDQVQGADMKTVVPIHNAVNERAWKEIKEWERPYTEGTSHDWVVDRCGVEVEYVIDFYAGRPGGKDAAGRPSFYLDVRPKLNSWEGVKMRAMRGLGMV